MKTNIKQEKTEEIECITFWFLPWIYRPALINASESNMNKHKTSTLKAPNNWSNERYPAMHTITWFQNSSFILLIRFIKLTIIHTRKYNRRLCWSWSDTTNDVLCTFIFKIKKDSYLEFQIKATSLKLK